MIYDINVGYEQITIVVDNVPLSISIVPVRDSTRKKTSLIFSQDRILKRSGAFKGLNSIYCEFP